MDQRQKQIVDIQKMAKIAEDRISKELLSSHIITAKPAVDINGADLLAIMAVENGAKFARIQCKGRSLPNPKSSNHVYIPKSYVRGTYTCFVYIGKERTFIMFFCI